jgi:acetate kinase
MKILVLNAGSSSQKSCLYQLSENALPEHPLKPIWHAEIDWTVSPGRGILSVKANGMAQEIQLETDDRRQGIGRMLDTLVTGSVKVLNSFSEIAIVGHRVVHGGTKYSQATIITPQVKAAIAELIPLAPTHNPAELEGIEAIEQLLDGVPQIAVFDTAFHAAMSPAAATYAIPYEWTEKGIRRYGFHGISHKYCSQRAAQLLGKPLESLKLITCHLGNGCSLAAVKYGISVNTTMGFTPLEGLMMGSRSGSLDPAILIYLMREYQLTAEQLNEMLNKNSGLKGVSGLSADLRGVLQGIAEGNQRAQLALDIYIHRLQFHIGAMLPSLGGIDALIFTAGVGENSSLVRQRTCEEFTFLGWKLDQQKNETCPPDCDISAPDSTIPILIIHTEEDWAIAQDCWQMV